MDNEYIIKYKSYAKRGIVITALQQCLKMHFSYLYVTIVIMVLRALICAALHVNPQEYTDTRKQAKNVETKYNNNDLFVQLLKRLKERNSNKRTATSKYNLFTVQSLWSFLYSHNHNSETHVRLFQSHFQ